MHLSSQRLDAEKFPMFSSGWTSQGFCRDEHLLGSVAGCRHGDVFSKENLNASRPSEHPTLGEKCQNA